MRTRFLLCSATFVILCAFMPRAHAQTVNQRLFATRADAVTVLMQARLGGVPDVKANDAFDDVVPGAWYERYIVTAERFGIIRKDVGSHRIRPLSVITRGEFLEMLANTFGLPNNLRYNYQDITANAWFAPFAGIAQRYGLFKDDANSLELHPLWEMKKSELSIAMRVFLEARGRERLGELPKPDLETVQEQSLYKVDLYQKISVELAERKSVPLSTIETGLPKTFVVSSSSSSSKAPVIVLVQSSSSSSAASSVAVIKSGMQPRTFSLPILISQAVAATNAERMKAGIPPLGVEPLLQTTAQKYAETMAKDGFFSHISPLGQRLIDRMKDILLPQLEPPATCQCVFSYVFGENLARSVYSGDEAVAAWMASKAHKEAILNPNFTRVGIGVYGEYWVEHFAGIKRQ